MGNNEPVRHLRASSAHAHMHARRRLSAEGMIIMVIIVIMIIITRIGLFEYSWCHLLGVVVLKSTSSTHEVHVRANSAQ